MKNKSKTAFKTILFAFLIAVMVLPLFAVDFAAASQNVNEETENTDIQYHQTENPKCK